MQSPTERQQALHDALATRILILDGAMGTMLQQRHLTTEDRGGAVLQDCPEYLVKSRPDVISDIHRAYLAAGADIIETNSFGTTPLVLAEFGIADQARDINITAAKLAREAADAFSTSAKPRFVAGSIGPTTKTLSVAGGSTFPELVENFYQQIHALVEGGIDIILIETSIDTRNIKAALIAANRVMQEAGRKIPVIVSGTIEVMGTMLAGQPADALVVSLQNAGLLSIGLNCATGPEFMTDHIRTISDMANTYVHCYPNAGLPLPDGTYPESPQSLAEHLDRFIRNGWLNVVGGCCGTTAPHIQAIAEMADGRKPRQVKPSQHRTYFSGTEVVEVEESARPLIVGERTNVIGSRAFKNLIAAEKWEEAVEIARRQVKNGAHIIDVCLQSTDRDEIADIPFFYEKLIRAASKPPIMIDTTDPKAIELALTYCQGKSIINSVNLEDGEEKFERVCPLAKAYGAALIVGTIDEDKLQAQAFTRERKLAVAQRSVDLLTTKYGIPPEDIIIDPLVFPCGTGDTNYIGGAVETIEAIRLIKQNIPYVRTALGISNISFGLPPAAREVINSVFLYYCTKAGLDLAIVNAEKLERFAAIPEDHRKLAEDLLFNQSPGAPADWRKQTPDQKAAINQHAIQAITEAFRNVAAKEKVKAADLPLDQRLANYILEGSKDGLIADLDRKLAEGAAPLDIVNGPLMAGMTEVGRLFNANELIVAEVLQSAEAMKAAVSHLEQFMEKADTATRGKIILATVKGDVHDIGKNLVEIILSNNGYQVINLGIKIPPEKLIEAWSNHRADAIGLSGLLVKSAQQMVITANDLKDAGITVPLLVGGAALSETFTNTRIGPAYGEAAVCYAKDAMTGLRIMNQLMDPAEREKLLADLRKKPAAAVASQSSEQPAAVPVSTERSRKVRTDIAIPAVPYLDRKVRAVPELTEVWSYINPFMLYGRHLGYKGRFDADLAARDPKALELYNMVEELKDFAKDFMQVKTVWQFFETERDGNSIHLFEPGAASPLHTFNFNRQPRENGLCLSDYVLPANDGKRDHLAFFVATAGAGIRERTETLKVNGEYFKAHGLQALAIETAEGCAEWIHRRIREDWGFPDPANMTMQERFTSRYRGKRYSFGYPACPNLDDQQGLFKFLRPEEIGVELTEGMMMEPEASVSAFVFHHPDAVYFTASDPGEAAAAD
ncbi:MAG TPA: methionine synthase [Bryobacteraceae bacterium]|jgi:5-methyltetrahydrofolate--homocysteine methyltransferase